MVFLDNPMKDIIMESILRYLLLLLLVSNIVIPYVFAEYEPGTQLALPEGALARLGKGWVEK